MLLVSALCKGKQQLWLAWAGIAEQDRHIQRMVMGATANPGTSVLSKGHRTSVADVQLDSLAFHRFL